MALAQFDVSKSGYVNFAQVRSYFLAFFTVVFDLSVSLQSHILPAASCEELASATASKAFRDCGVSNQAQSEGRTISFVQFRQWCSKEEEQQQRQQGVGASPGGRIVQDSEEDEEEDESGEEEEQEDEEDEEEDEAEDERVVAEARYWLQQQRMQQAQKANGAATQRAGQPTQQPQIRTRL